MSEHRWTYRVTGIDESSSESDLIAILTANLHINPQDVIVESLAGSHRPQQKAATVILLNVPPELKAKIDRKGGYEIKRERHLPSIVVDHYFFGLTQLNVPIEDSLFPGKIYCVAIHGLGGNAFGSWKAEYGDFMWLRDVLPKDFPQMTCAVYGYDSEIALSKTFQQVQDIAVTLLQYMDRLISTRPTDSKYSVIFIAHSLGGIILKHALNLLYEQRSQSNIEDAFELELESIIGAIFFGVPNLGFNVDDLSAIAKGNANEQLLESCKRGSRGMTDLSDSFNAQHSELIHNIFFVYETETTNLVHLTNGRIRKTDERAVFLDEESATYGYTSHNNKLPLTRDHRSLVKFEHEQHQDYDIIKGRMEKLVAKARLRLVPPEEIREPKWRKLISAFPNSLQKRRASRSEGSGPSNGPSPEILAKKPSPSYFSNNQAISLSPPLLSTPGGPGFSPGLSQVQHRGSDTSNVSVSSSMLLKERLPLHPLPLHYSYPEIMWVSSKNLKIKAYEKAFLELNVDEDLKRIRSTIQSQDGKSRVIEVSLRAALVSDCTTFYEKNSRIDNFSHRVSFCGSHKVTKWKEGVKVLSVEDSVTYRFHTKLDCSVFRSWVYGKYILRSCKYVRLVRLRQNGKKYEKLETVDSCGLALNVWKDINQVLTIQYAVQTQHMANKYKPYEYRLIPMDAAEIRARFAKSGDSVRVGIMDDEEATALDFDFHRDVGRSFWECLLREWHNDTL